MVWRKWGRTVGKLQLTHLAADFDHYMAELAERRSSACRVNLDNPFDSRDTPDLFTILSEPWSETEVREFLELVRVPDAL